MNWLNIYGDNKSIVKALDELSLGETVKAERGDRKRLSSAIINSFGAGSFTLKVGKDEEDVKVVLITRNTLDKVKRIPKVKTFIHLETIGLLVIKDNTATLRQLPLNISLAEWVDELDKSREEIIKRSQSFCEANGLTLKY